MYDTLVPKNDLVRIGQFEVQLSSVGNPDFGQYSDRPLPDVPSSTVKTLTMESASKLCLDFIAEHQLGGGNWNGGLIKENSVPVARVSYNGKVWGP